MGAETEMDRAVEAVEEGYSQAGLTLSQRMMFIRIQLYAAAQKLRGDELREFRDLVDEVQLTMEVLHGKR